MKTIEQEASNFAHKKINSIPEGHIQTLPRSFVMAASIDGFNEGVKFAQQWISVEDELPNTTEKILVKGKSGIVYLSYFNPKNNLFSSNCRITHWRPISFL